MTPRELVAKLSQLPDDHVIYVQGDAPTATSVAESRARGSMPIGLKYVLRGRARPRGSGDVVEGALWPSTDEAVEAILYYAEHDAHQPV